MAISSLCVGVLGCGYALVGRGVTVLPDVKRVGVPLFKDATGRPGLDQLITQKIVMELTKRGRFEVVQERENVDAIVEGELASFIEVPVGIATGSEGIAQVSSYSIRVLARVKFIKKNQQEPLWSNDAFSFQETYDMGDEATSLVESDQAMERLATAFARQLVADMLEAF